MKKLATALLAALLVFAGIAGASSTPTPDPTGRANPGQVWCVNSRLGGDTNSGKGWDRALATLDAAVNKCTANTNDVILLAPDHAESLAADSAVDIDVAGVTVIGLSQGRLMPTFTFITLVTADFKLAAANVTVRGVRFLGGVDALTGCIEVTGADCALIDCEYRDVTGQATDAVLTVDGADRLTIDGFRFMGAAGAGANAAIALDGSDDALIRNVWIHGNFAVGAIDLRTTASARIRIQDATIWTANAADVCIVDTITASTGIIGPNIFCQLTDNAANVTTAVTGATFTAMSPILVVNLAGEQGMAIDWTTTVDE